MRRSASIGVSSSKTTTASTDRRADSTRARSSARCNGRCGPLRRRTESSEFRHTTSRSPSARAASRVATWPECSRSKQPPVATTTPPAARTVFAFVISSVRIVLLLAVAVGPGLAGLLGTHDVRLGDLVLTHTGPGLTLLVGGVVALAVSAYATRQVVPARSRTRFRDVLRLLWGRSDLFSAASSGVGLFVVVEGADRELTPRYTADLAQVLRDCGCPRSEERRVGKEWRSRGSP